MLRPLLMLLNLFAALLLMGAPLAFAQRYPVQGTLSIAAPYPACLSDSKGIADIDKAAEDVRGVFTGGTDVGKVKTGSDTTSHQVNFDIPEPCKECSYIYARQHISHYKKRQDDRQPCESARHTEVQGGGGGCAI